MREYDLFADWYWTDRARTVGVAEALAVAATLPAALCILDIGCGNGVPITEVLEKAGHRVVGLDTSTGMLARFRVNLPGTPAVRGDVRNCPFSHGSFDAAVSWGMMFHVQHRDQPAAFEGVSRVLKPGASFLFTAAEIDGADDAGIIAWALRILPRRTQLVTRSCAEFSKSLSRRRSTQGGVSIPGTGGLTT